MAQIYISLGSNVNKEHYISQALKTLTSYFPHLEHSSVFESEAVGFTGSNFYNSVVGAQTEMPLEQLCQLLKNIEQENGRTANDKKFSPRTLDLDLLFYDDIVCDSPAQLPRDEITKNAFVLQPLAEIAPNFYHPVAEQTIAQLWSNYNNPNQKLWKVEFTNP
ncbi:MAG: 2-amino-4-hydroxy-6-hydroxymethyldihydropteridine diphosphokinase [Pseudoalteromonas sp.]|uniref:2-amino-4-hydroxy-6- hydroxymethyldihydropteridine diphosphokinase n=1 Tax=unclassified Pseudoalteromonas TaxID=194690 RepID=UPI000C07B94D|nr:MULTISPECIES: 2-amino-4-hydroxy-6-hydroxymethyldihydropteridine diphosphokinase [unclassified Pseudoalteromonas]MDB2355758.1 2-amino-4-hydroxy-6-hydroxymethyldihydropteridine diphosphokinase [Pseudoalteromonas sp.]MDP2633956.1 2-amino-4-hydroxy-6-hydroxymethyldihydropteridine diphosphokinase [Pseudoalteromonas sp. 1_MG-2023]PHN90809.1 2-amino-4-hydroxy-6-hydroxymethyldihydropteridine diphosphokinase [Pseudoalteromonas sp. 3D05]TGE76895.1 2-amino-4-hydroxy-6-hydroxymethyldihydropteridine diph